jgi:hypothetical protein
VACFKAQNGHLRGMTEENYEGPQLGQPVSGP